MEFNFISVDRRQRRCNAKYVRHSNSLECNLRVPDAGFNRRDALHHLDGIRDFDRCRRVAILLLFKQCLKIGIIAAFVMTADGYTSTVVSAMQGLESGIADIMSSPSATSTNIYQVLDKSVNSGLDVAYDMMGKAAKREFYEIGQMFWDLINALMMAIAVFLIHLPAAATIIMAKLGLGILLGIGPLFIAALMFPITAPWFDKWFQQAMASILEIAIVMVVVTVGVALYKALLDKRHRDGR